PLVEGDLHMSPRHPQRVLVGAVALGLVFGLAATTAIAAPVGRTARRSKAVKVKWNRIDGPTGAGNEIGLVHGADGLLHVVWINGTTSSTISDTKISPAGLAAGTSTIATGRSEE